MIEGKRCDGIRRIPPDAWQLAHAGDCAWKMAGMSIRDDSSGGVQIARPRIIAEALPRVEDVIFRSPSQRGEMGEAAEPLIIIRDNGGNLGLLEHELGDEDRVGIASLTPGEGAPVAAIPTKKRAMEDAKVWSRNQS